eukprot:1417828-Prymnesium_polylepis.1
MCKEPDPVLRYYGLSAAVRLVRDGNPPACRTQRTRDRGINNAAEPYIRTYANASLQMGPAEQVNMEMGRPPVIHERRCPLLVRRDSKRRLQEIVWAGVDR